MSIIVLISCSSKKANRKTKAGNLYISPLFKYSLAYAYRLEPDKIFILSALHHVVDLETEIEPYDVTLSNVSAEIRKKKPFLRILSKVQKAEWGREVIRQLAGKASLGKDSFILLAGREYIKPLQSDLIHLYEPLKGKKNGQRLQFLRQAIHG